jgi:hypothetical protein
MKMRGELRENPTVKKIAERIKRTVKSQPTGGGGLSVAVCAKAAYGLAKGELGDKATYNGISRICEQSPVKEWSARSMSQLVWGLSKGEHLTNEKPLLQAIIKELQERVRELDADSLSDLLWGIAQARVQRDGATQTVIREDADDALFRKVTTIVLAKLDQFQPRQLADIVDAYVRMGIKDDKLFKDLGPKILAKQNELTDDQMAKCIKAYSRFGIPLRTTAKTRAATVVVGDFQRPSDFKRPTTKDKDQHPVSFSMALQNDVM